MSMCCSLVDALLRGMILIHLAAIHLFEVVFTHPKIKRTWTFKKEMERELEQK